MDLYNKNMQKERCGVIILAGGKSSRMGTNKALLPVHGQPNIKRIRDELRNLDAADSADTSRFIIVTNDPPLYEFLGEETVGDKYPGLGPLAGIQAGLQASPCSWNLVIACDMPLITAEAARYMLVQAADVDAVVPVIGGQLHPLFAVYHKRCSDKIEDMLVSGQLRMIYLLDKLRVKQVTESDFPKHIDTQRVFYNMNRPEEWQQVQQWLDDEGRGNG